MKRTSLAFSQISRVIVIIIALSQHATAQFGDLVKPRMRVIIDNDFSGDPDGLFQLAHLVLSPSVEIRGVIGSHLKVSDGFDNSTTQADNASKKAKELIALLKPAKIFPIVAGSNTGMINDSTPVKSDAVQLIIQEAMRTDTKQPLYVLCGAGLTEIASALLTNPAISNKLILVWIGGPEYADLAAPPPGYSNPEYNLNIDIHAARTVFNKTPVPIWQIPRNAYRQAILPYSELVTRVKPHGPVGGYLHQVFSDLMKRLEKFGLDIGETY
ncbi:MAG: nucleoside hydrolase, partial [Chitinophagaceae bacterium]